MSATGEADGPPLRPGVAYADLCAGMAGVVGILAAVTARERTGRGQQVDIGMFDVQVSLMNYVATHASVGRADAAPGQRARFTRAL